MYYSNGAPYQSPIIFDDFGKFYGAILFKNGNVPRLIKRTLKDQKPSGGSISS